MSGDDGQLSASGYESWFVSARDPGSARALWIRHTRHRPSQGAESVALRCAVFDRDLGGSPGMVKQVFTAFPPGAAAGPGRFRGQAAMGEQAAGWDLAVAGGQPPLRPLRPAALSVTAADDAAVAVPYTDPRGGTRTVSHAGLATVELTLHRAGDREVGLSSSRGAYEYASRQEMPGITLQQLPEG